MRPFYRVLTYLALFIQSFFLLLLLPDKQRKTTGVLDVYQEDKHTIKLYSKGCGQGNAYLQIGNRNQETLLVNYCWYNN